MDRGERGTVGFNLGHIRRPVPRTIPARLKVFHHFARQPVVGAAAGILARAELFVVAADATLTDRATALATVFANASLGTSARSGSTDTGKSSAELSVSSVATTATLPLRIVGLVDDDANNDYASAGAHLLVRLNAHFNAGSRRFDSQTTADSTGI